MDIRALIFKRPFKIYYYDHQPKYKKLITLLRVRNEELILSDTLDHLSVFSDGIIAYDDASTDETFSILSSHPKVIAIIRNRVWEQDPMKRIILETSHRASLLELAQKYSPEWIFCADADERYLGDIGGFIHSSDSSEVDIVRVSLFDAYLTIEDCNEYKQGTPLVNFRRFFGPERRDIVMLWRNSLALIFDGLDAREPLYPSSKNVMTKFMCQHYGKSLSIRHWEDTCDYYMNHMPYDPYGKKWSARKGMAIHVRSDFDNSLYLWDQHLFNNAITIHP